MTHPNLVAVATFPRASEAELAKSALESAEIDAMVTADSAGGMEPQIAWAGGGYRVLVTDEDLADAKLVLEPVA